MDAEGNIIPFDRLEVTTSTMLVSFNGNVGNTSAFHLFPITRMDLPPKVGRGKTYVIPHYPIPGHVLATRNGPTFRGVRWTSSEKYFQNCIPFCVSAKRENIKGKLLSNGIHTCGPKTVEEGLEITQYMIDHLKTIQQQLDYCQQNYEAFYKTVRWFLHSTRGPQRRRYYTEAVNNADFAIADGSPFPSFLIDSILTQPKDISDRYLACKFRDVIVEHIDYFRCTVTYSLEQVPVAPEPVEMVEFLIDKFEDYEEIAYPQYFPEGIDKNIASFLTQTLEGLSTYSDVLGIVDWISTFPYITSPELSIGSHDVYMVNYNYPIGWEVNRNNMNELFNNVPDFSSTYANDITSSVRIILPYELTEEEEMRRRPDANHHNTFLVFLSGKVTHIGPGGKRMEDAYYRFMNIVRDNQQFLRLHPNVATFEVTDSPKKLQSISYKSPCEDYAWNQHLANTWQHAVSCY